MAELNEKPAVYYIPENYIEEGRILQGSVKVKNLIQGALLALPLGLIGWKLGKNLEASVALSIFCAGPMLVFGIIGYNDDALITVIRLFTSWRKEKTVRIYNPTPKPFYVSPTETIFSTTPGKDRLIGAVEERQQKKLEEHMSETLIEGETFDFVSDPTLEKYHDESQRPAEGFVQRHIVTSDDDLSILFGNGKTDLGGFRKQEKPVDFGGDDQL